MEILKNFIHSLNFIQIISLALYAATNIWFIKLIFNIYIDLEGFKLAFFLMAIAIFGFSLDFSNGKLNIISAVTMLAIMLLISLVSVVALAIHLKIKQKEIENDEVE
jgi:hypothetical protein